MERLGVADFPLYPLQMILHLYMYKQKKCEVKMVE